MILSEPEGRFYIARSTIPKAGEGLFAEVPVSKGDRFEVIGALIRAGSMADRSSRYADAYKFRVGRLLLVPVGFGGMVNHSVKPNMKKTVRGHCLYLDALRRIERGDEILFTYSKYAQARFGLVEGEVRRTGQKTVDTKGRSR